MGATMILGMSCPRSSAVPITLCPLSLSHLIATSTIKSISGLLGMVLDWAKRALLRRIVSNGFAGVTEIISKVSITELLLV